MSRLPDIPADELTAEQRAVVASVTSGPRGVLRGPVKAWLHSPDLAARAQHLGAYCRFGSSLGPRLLELSVLIVAAHWRSAYEWWAHEELALKAGLPPATIESLRTGERPVALSAGEAAVYDVATSLLSTGFVDDASFARALETLAPRGVVDLVGVLGYYGLVAMTANCFAIPPTGGQPSPFDGTAI